MHKLKEQGTNSGPKRSGFRLQSDMREQCKAAEVPYETSERVLITMASSKVLCRERDKERLAVHSRFSTEITDLFVLFSPQDFF